jgi:hypothetical protein
LKGSDQAGEAAREHRPGEVVKSHMKPAKGVLIGLQTAENLRQSCLVGVYFSMAKTLIQL